MNHQVDIIKVSDGLDLRIHHLRDAAVLLKTSKDPPFTSIKMTMDMDEFKTMVAQYLLLRHMERAKELSADQLLDAISIQL